MFMLDQTQRQTGVISRDGSNQECPLDVWELNRVVWETACWRPALREGWNISVRVHNTAHNSANSYGRQVVSAKKKKE